MIVNIHLKFVLSSIFRFKFKLIFISKFVRYILVRTNCVDTPSI